LAAGAGGISSILFQGHRGLAAMRVRGVYL